MQEYYTEEIKQDMPNPVIIQAGDMLVLSKTNAQEFHQKMREIILDTGYGMFEYLEVLKFFENVNKQVKGDSQAKIPEDYEFIQAVRDELSKYEKGKYTTTRGVRFELAETGTAYDFSNCNDEQLKLLEIELQSKKEAVEIRKEFLKSLPKEGLEILTKDGEVLTIYPPIKKSKSSYKITLAK
jgi:hypothetical protein